MRVTLMLCDHAQVAEGKLFISGGGWNVTDALMPTSAIAVIFGVPWTQANQLLDFELELQDEDGHTVEQLTSLPGSAAQVKITGQFEVGRPVGAARGADLEAPMAFPIPQLSLKPGCRYAWVLRVLGATPEEWRLPFSTRPA